MRFHTNAEVSQAIIDFHCIRLNDLQIRWAEIPVLRNWKRIILLFTLLWTCVSSQAEPWGERETPGSGSEKEKFGRENGVISPSSIKLCWWRFLYRAVYSKNPTRHLYMLNREISIRRRFLQYNRAMSNWHTWIQDQLHKFNMEVLGVEEPEGKESMLQLISRVLKASNAFDVDPSS